MIHFRVIISVYSVVNQGYPKARWFGEIVKDQKLPNAESDRRVWQKKNEEIMIMRQAKEELGGIIPSYT